MCRMHADLRLEEKLYSAVIDARAEYGAVSREAAAAYALAFTERSGKYNAVYWRDMSEKMAAQLIKISQTLATFYRAPISMSSLQPILDLTVELNPALKETK